MNFSDQTLNAGLKFEHTTTSDHQSGPMIAGGAVGDFNNDGYPDVFVLGGGLRDDGLFINNRDGTFTDRAVQWGVADRHRSVGVTVGDVDGDGDDDIFVTSLGPMTSFAQPGKHRLYLNQGDHFVDVAQGAGVATTTTTHPDGYGASFGDYDRDGDLDLFVGAWHNAAVLGSRLFRNRGDGTFENATDKARVMQQSTRAFGAIFADMDGDFFPELLVAGDFGTSRYYRNNTDGSFTELDPGTGLPTSANQWGVARAHNAMGMALADFNRDGRPDWFITAIWPTAAFEHEFWGNGLYINHGDHVFTEQSQGAGVNDGGWGWGTEAADFDHDGWTDLVMTNGWPFADNVTGESFDNESAYLWRNRGDLSFADLSQDSGLDHANEGRALLTLDYDRDGDMDVIILSHQQPARLYRNEIVNGETPSDAHWLQVRLDTRGTSYAPYGLGARVTVVTRDGEQTQVVASGASYLGQSERVLHFGLGEDKYAQRVTVEWSPNDRQALMRVPADRSLSIRPQGRTLRKK